MDNFTFVTTDNHNAYMKEKEFYIKLLKERSEIFVEEAKAVSYTRLDVYKRQP